MPEVFELTIDAGPPGVIDARQQRALDVELLDDGLEDPVGVGEPREVRRRSSPVVMSFHVSGVKNGSGFSAARALEALFGRFGGDVEQQRRERRRWRNARRSARP